MKIKQQIGPGLFNWVEVPDPPPQTLRRISDGRTIAPKPPCACANFGAPTGKLVPCESCFNTKLKTFACEKHGECTVDRKAKGIACCNPVDGKQCPDYEIAPATRDRSVREWLAFIEGPVQTPPPGWTAWPNVQEAHRQAMRRAVATTPPMPSIEGRGIVIAGGGSYFASAYITARVIRHVGCDLPIQVWMLPKEENARHKAILESIPGVAVIIAGPQSPTRVLGGWQLKTYAVLNCPWREVLYLDADSYPAKNPACLFEWGRYKEEGSIFFPDIASWDLKDEAWPLFGLDPVKERPWESGQFVVDKESCWREINLAHWFNQHSDYYYAHQGIGLHGDKDLFHFAWRVLERTFYHPFHQPAGWELHTILQKDHEGKVIFQHRVRDKFYLENEQFGTTSQTFRKEKKNRKCSRLAHEDFCFTALDDLRRRMKAPNIEAVILTCPERKELLAQTMANLMATDWGVEPTIVLDMNTHHDKRERMTLTCRRLLTEALAKPWEYLLFLEDDLQFNRYFRHNLETWAPLAAGDLMLGSLYRPDHVVVSPTGEAKVNTVYGSQAFVMSRACVTFVLSQWDTEEGMQDIRLSRLAARLGPVLYHLPSIVQHVGRLSAWTGDDSRFHEANDFNREFKRP